METAPRDILPQFDHRNGHMNGVHTSKGRHTRDLFLLDGRSIIVTGATGGLGLQIVKGILESGADVLAIDRVDTPKNNPQWDELTRTADKNGTILTYHRCDISDPHSTKAAFNEAVSHARHPLRGLVNCAGIGTVGPSVSFNMDEARKIIEVNLLGTMICAQAAARLIQQQNHNLPASFVLIASMSGYVVNKGTPVAAYAASKAGVQQLARNLASEWGGNTEVAFCNSTKEEEKQAEGSSDFPPSIIRVNTVSPGVIRTPMTAGVLTHEHLERLWTDQTMLKRLSVPEDYVGPVLFLLSDASAYVTGADLLVDGGYTHCSVKPQPGRSPSLWPLTVTSRHSFRAASHPSTSPALRCAGLPPGQQVDDIAACLISSCSQVPDYILPVRDAFCLCLHPLYSIINTGRSAVPSLSTLRLSRRRCSVSRASVPPSSRYPLTLHLNDEEINWPLISATEPPSRDTYPAGIMSVKFEKEQVRATAPFVPGGRDETTAHKIGEALTGGKQQTGYLAAYLKQLQSNPLRTKMLTSGTLSALQELLASWLAHDRSKHGHYFSSRIPKMAIYGAFISAPMGHVLIGFLQWIFAGRTSLKAKILQILTSNLVIAPIQNTVYLASMAVIAGARTWHQIRATVRAGFWPVMKVSWITSPIALAFAQKFLPEQTWVPFFNIVAFCIGTYINTHTKKKRLAALRKKHYGDGRSSSGRPDDRF